MKPDPGPIEQRFRIMMQELAKVLDRAFNTPGEPKTTGFVLLLFPFGEDDMQTHRCNYISNASREDVVKLLREQADYFEGKEHHGS